MTEETGTQVTILKPNHFCEWTNPDTGKSEIGVAHGYFAGNMFAKTWGNEYITEVSGTSFGWMDMDGEYWKCNKHQIRRPAEDTLIRALSENTDFRKICIELELVKEEIVTGKFKSFIGPLPHKICEN